ncbi:uncharacterized protein I206_107339 [Kwoniella pini CBS 10737]|uniref:Uncharacterized protein n=1 Tax=Kwoniella pini CBS 10737 TaxID=1296096 RepID=A0A1B9HX07_9TREE|nr:uncharacterized protein I206_05665 [Kwoniella pini CBS 10737]OCF47806.1 hypothetical protein I206_05665 [Kwoniella pini CBS 10737]
MSLSEGDERDNSAQKSLDPPHPVFAISSPDQPTTSIPTSPELSPAPSPPLTPSRIPKDDPADKLTSKQEVDLNLSEGSQLDTAKQDEGESIDGEVHASKSAADELEQIEESRRPDMLKVHWKSRLRDHHIMDMKSIQRSASSDNEGEARSARQVASKLVRKHTGRSPRLPTPTSDSDSDLDPDNGPSSSAVSLNSTDSPNLGSRSRGRRRSSGKSSRESSIWETSDDESEDDRSVKPRGVLSALLGLYRDDPGGREKGNLRSLLTGQGDHRDRHGRKKRRWSSQSLFATASASSSVHGSRRSSMNNEEEFSGSDLEERLKHEKARVHRNRRHQQLPHRSQNLEEPYIPSPHFSNVIRPPPNVGISQKIRRFMIGHGYPATWFGYINSAPGTSAEGTGSSQRAMAALIIASSSLAGAASPTLSHIAPAYGEDAETSNGARRISWYDGVDEPHAIQEDLDRRVDEELGTDGENGTNLEKDMEEGRLKGRRSRNKRRRGKRTQKEMAVTKHVSNIIQRKKFIEMLAKAVVSYGAPAHSVEAWLSATADILSVEASFFFLPSVLIVAFRDSDVHSTDILFIRPSGGLELYRLSLVHEVYRKVVHDEISASQGCRVLRRIEHRTVPYSRWALILAAAVASATSAKVAFSGSFIDILMSGALGSTLAIVQFTIAEKNKLVSNIFEIAMAGILSFIARGLGASNYFCYESLASAAIVLILPGWHICLGALELGSKNVVAGAIRLVWAVVYTLFLSLGLGIGSQIWDSFGPSQPTAMTSTTSASMATITGSFNSNNTYWDQTFNNGTFTFSNSTSSTAEVTTVACYRNPDWNYWWYQEVSDWWLFLLVPLFAFSLAVWFRADCRSKDIFVMVLVACAGYVVNFYLSEQIDQTNVVSAVSAFTLGILGNLYSRLGGGSAFPSMVVGILLIVPNAIAAAGGLSSSGSSEDSSSDSSSASGDEINAAVIVSIRMVQVGIGLAIGLFAAALVIYPFGKKRRYIFSY